MLSLGPSKKYLSKIYIHTDYDLRKCFYFLSFLKSFLIFYLMFINYWKSLLWLTCTHICICTNWNVILHVNGYQSQADLAQPLVKQIIPMQIHLSIVFSNTISFDSEAT